MPSLPCPVCDAMLEVGAAPGDAGAATCPRCGRPPVVCGAYRLRALLGRGGMATVYEAVREPDGARVAVKVLVPRSHGDWLAWELFARSTRVLQGLAHPALPRVHAFAHGEAARLVLVREVFDGGTLAERIRDQDRRLAPAQVRAILRALLELLAYLQGLVPPVVHRDVKPSNIMFRTPADWDPVLVDFDTVAPPPGRGTGLTIVGTPGYAAPEQFAGDPTPASDVYGLGATMLFVATHLHADELPRRQGRFEVADRLRGLDPATTAVILRMVEPALDARYASAAAALRDLDAAAPPAATAPGPAPPPPAVGARRRHDTPTLILPDDGAAPPGDGPTQLHPPPPAPAADVPTLLLAGADAPGVAAPPVVTLGEAACHAVIYGDRSSFQPVGYVTAGVRLRLLDRRVHIDCYGEDIVHVQIVGGDAPTELGKSGWLPVRFTDFTVEPDAGDGPLVALRHL